MTQDATAEMFGPYELRSLLGRGGMGEVFRAYDTVRKRTVALKRLPRNLAGDADYQARFRREAEIAARLTEPHIIPIHDYGEIDGQLYIDMRLIAGTDLADVLAKEGPLPPRRAVGIVGQVASALAAAHAEGLVHRDVKPSNVLISVNDRGEDFVHLVDFGIARDENATGLTVTGTTVGTIDYMAPERIEHGECDHRVDVYALGCVLYEALTAAKPFPVSGAAAKMFAHIYTQPPRPSQSRPGIPPALDEVVAIAMAKDPGHRYPTVTDLATAAQRALDGRPATQVRPPTAAPPPTRISPPQGHSAPPRTATAGVGWTTGGPPTARPPQPANTRIAFPAGPGTSTAHHEPQQAPERRTGGRRTIYLVLAAMLVIGGITAAVLLNQRTGTVTGLGTTGTSADVTPPARAPSAASSDTGGAAPVGVPAGTTTVTDLNGNEVQLQTASLEICTSDGLTLTTGQQVPTSQISRIDVTEPEAREFAVSVTLTSGEQVAGRMTAGCQVSGTNSVGPYAQPLERLQTVVVGR
ncbi:protein kinase domain-containing protein [Pseudonocardia sp. CA-107938]|uniref:serine/threonine-protein kinase n=1 Tax=Pseudonocardia sp. CA-107938 TaxID=3240021 RepID=UPI003D8CC61D